MIKNSNTFLHTNGTKSSLSALPGIKLPEADVSGIKSVGKTAKDKISSIVSKKYGELGTKHLFDDIADSDVEKNIPIAESTIQTNVDRGLLDRNKLAKLPNLRDGLALSYAAADVGNKKATNMAKEAAYMESNEPWLKETETRLLSNDTSGMLKKANEPKNAQKKSYSKKDDSFLNYASAALALASFVPGADTVTNLISIPIDLAKGDYGSALLDAAGVIPALGELADVAKVARKADDISDVAKIAKKGDNIADIGKVDKVTNVVETGDGVRDVGKVKHSLEITKKISPYQIEPTHSITLSKNKYAELVDDIRKNGVIEPIKYVEHNGTKYVVDGHHRLQAAKELKLKDIPVQEVTLPYKGYKDISDLEWYN